uniref:5-hydroxytryptamine receptor n=1 Tax=Cacopsylla melanoneura TaxID=428564 RepID=A0A8D8S7B9_9HEMI
MFILNYLPVLSQISSSRSSSQFGGFLKCLLLFLHLITFSSEHQERHNNDSLQIYLPKSHESNVQSPYSLISSFTKLLPKTTNKTIAKNISLSKELQQAENISPSYFVLTKSYPVSTSPSGFLPDNLTNTDLMGADYTSPTQDITGPSRTNNNTSISSHPLPNLNSSSETLDIRKENINRTKPLQNATIEFDTSRRVKSTPPPTREVTTQDTTTRPFSPNIFNYFPELNTTLELYNPSSIEYKLINEYNTSSGNITLYPDDPTAFNSSNTTLAGEPLGDMLLLGGLSVLLGIMILSTVIGNVFVIAAILLEKNLQSVANYLIVSLAVADLMVACLVMPLGAVYEISRGWILGPELCDMWTSSDVLCCTASILHLVAIAVDRYWAVTNVDYIHTRNANRIIIMIVVVWSVAFIVSLAPQLGWKDPEYMDRINQQKCMVSQDLGYQIFATCSTFYVPLLVILVLYWKIFQTARKRIRRRRQQRNALNLTAKNQDSIDNKTTHFIFFRKRKFFKMKKCTNVVPPSPNNKLSINVIDEENGINNATTSSSLILADGHSISDTDRRTSINNEASTAFTITHNNGASQTNHSNECVQVKVKSHVTKKEKKESLEAKRERKAAKTLAIITGAFVICWLPFFMMALLLPLCQSCYISDYLASFFLWLGYFNSTLNPVIYTVFSPEFRQAFKRILCGSPNRGRFR